MDKVKKSLVRNAQVTLDLNKPRKISCNKQNKPKLTTESSGKTQSDGPKTDYNSPELNSLLKLTEQINKIERLKFDKVKIKTSDEEVSNKVNFPYDKAIYKDLMPLNVKTSRKVLLQSREPHPSRDKEPKLNDFVVENHETCDLIYEPPLFRAETRIELAKTNNLRLYKVLELLK